MAGPATAAEPPASITLAEARAFATRSGPDVVLAELRSRVARTGVDVAGALANPTLGVHTARQTAKLSATLGIPLPVFGQRHAAISAAEADAEVARLDVDAIRLDARWNATRAWLDLWEAQERTRVFEAAATDAERVAAIAKERFEAGSAPRLDVIRTGADRARARAEATAVAGAIPAASARLAVWIGGLGGEALRASGPIDLGILPPESEAAARLAAQHPVVKRDRAQTEAAASHLRSEQRLRWPVVTADLGVAYRDPTLPGTDVIAGLSFEPPVLSLRGGAIARARADQALAEATTEYELRRLTADVVAAYRESESAAERARALGYEVLPALEEARRMTEEGYRAGRVDLLHVLETQSAVLSARLASVEAQAIWQRARADVEKAIGATSPGQAGP
jgi:cobalt-zinc-cadmium efflux system outer membrane protein